MNDGLFRVHPDAKSTAHGALMEEHVLYSNQINEVFSTSMLERQRVWLNTSGKLAQYLVPPAELVVAVCGDGLVSQNDTATPWAIRSFVMPIAQRLFVGMGM